MTVPKTCLVVIIVALAMASQGSANLITNPGFEDPIGPEWTYTLVSGDAAYWTYGQSAAPVHSGASSYKLQFGPQVTTSGKSYVEQVLSGLTPGASYDISGWINLYWRADKTWGYIEVEGGGAPVQAPAKGANVVGSWQQYTLSQTADAGGSLKVRLYLDKYSTTTLDKTAAASFDDIVVTPEPATTLLLVAGFLGLAALRCRR